MARNRQRKLAGKQGSSSARLKTPSQKRDISPEQQPPIFSLEYLQKDYCVTVCQVQDQAKFAIRLRKLSEMTWKEIKSAPRHGLGHEKISRNSIQESIPSHITDDVTFLAFRFSGMKPMVGYRSGRIFYVIWLDKDFTLYDHGS
ncbi:hypothetical protein [Leptothoe kymatousa]|uniref:Uncharacterized protein n=1 Tax=Leptothoe kymatousa TAU-MAC 1615 TaxID=2364775 RepID=A0ABS5Y2X8_9CYAN|nr:hypothetical protein [Leptothoe kymatousa]MBT9312156.1 hypothetical protein [Leptothoe kymatousa TAU-MAC 1615]